MFLNVNGALFGKIIPRITNRGITSDTTMHAHGLTDGVKTDCWELATGNVDCVSH